MDQSRVDYYRRIYAHKSRAFLLSKHARLAHDSDEWIAVDSLLKDAERAAVEKTAEATHRHMEQIARQSERFADKAKRSLERGTLMAVAALIATVISAVGTFRDFRKAEDLSAQIVRVDGALSALKDLESNLSKVKVDLVETANEKKKVEEEWEKAKLLQTLTKEQYAAFRSAVSERTASSIVLDNLWAFLLGVASSLLASFIWLKWRGRTGEST